MPTVAVYLRASDERQLIDRGIDPQEWVRGTVKDGLLAELELPPVPGGSYESHLRQAMRLEMYAGLRRLLVDGLVLDVATLDEMMEVIKRIPS